MEGVLRQKNGIILVMIEQLASSIASFIPVVYGT